MNIEFSSIANAGNLDQERLVLRVTGDDDLEYYAVFQCNTSSDGSALAGNIPLVFWFSGKKVKAGDLIALYSKGGTKSEKKNDDGTTSHFFYWHRGTPIWIGEKRAAIVHTATWSFGAPLKKAGAA
jgi:hypothetical protein